MAGQTLQKQPFSGAYGEFGVGGVGGAPCLDPAALRQEASLSWRFTGGCSAPLFPCSGTPLGPKALGKRGRSTPRSHTALIWSWSLLDTWVKVRPARESCASSREFPPHRSQRSRDGPGGRDSSAAGAPLPSQWLLPPQRSAQPISYSLNCPSSHFHWGPCHRQVSYSRRPSSLQLGSANVSVVLTNLYWQ